MDRRMFVLLTGATSGALIRPPVRLSHSPTGADRRSGGPAVGRPPFQPHDPQRWSPWDYGDGPPPPPAPRAGIGGWGGGPPPPPPALGESPGRKPRPPRR